MFEVHLSSYLSFDSLLIYSGISRSGYFLVVTMGSGDRGGEVLEVVLSGTGASLLGWGGKVLGMSWYFSFHASRMREVSNFALLSCLLQLRELLASFRLRSLTQVFVDKYVSISELIIIP